MEMRYLNRLKRRKSYKRIIQYFVLIIFLVISLYPIYFSIISSLKSSNEIFLNPFSFPTNPQVSNYINAFTNGNIGMYFKNSLILTGLTLAVLFFVGTLASYVLARFKFKMRTIIFTMFISGMMIPIQSVIIPLSYLLGVLNLKNNYLVLILIYAAFQLPITIFIITGFIKSLPKEIEEAAVMDGCGAFQVYWKIIVPLVIPGIVTALIFDFLNIWNNLLFPLVFISDPKQQVISMGLLSFSSMYTADYGGLMAGIVISIIPPVIIYMLLQEKVVKGITAGGVKG